jgi:hypothetical protein
LKSARKFGLLNEEKERDIVNQIDDFEVRIENES